MAQDRPALDAERARQPGGRGGGIGDVLYHRADAHYWPFPDDRHAVAVEDGCSFEGRAGGAQAGGAL